MAKSFDYRIHPYQRSPDQDAPSPVRHPVVVAGGGMVGLAFAVDMAQRGVPVVVLDDGDQVSIGSRAICISKRSLEIFDRLGIGERCMAKGVTWSKGKVLRGDDLLYAFDSYVPPRAPAGRRNTRRSGSVPSRSGRCRRIPIRERRARTRHRNPPPILRGRTGGHRRPGPGCPRKADPFLGAAVCFLETARDRRLHMDYS